MPKKKSIKLAAEEFVLSVEDVIEFLNTTLPGTSPEYHGWLYDHALVRLYRYFESLILNALIGAINHDTRTLSERTGRTFPRHLTNDVCEYLVIGDGYFDFKGRDGLIRQLRRFVTETHYLVTIVKQPKYKATLEQLSALRNYTSHYSAQSKVAAKKATGAKRLRCAGVWIGAGKRFSNLTDRLIELANEIESAAPY